MMRILKSGWMLALIGSVLYLGTTFYFMLGAAELRRPAGAAGLADDEAVQVIGPSWDFRNPELDRMIEEMTQQKIALIKREQSLNELEIRLRAERQELTTATQMVARLQKEFDQNVIRLKEQESVNLKRLAKNHAAMSPEGSATILKELPEDEAAKLMLFLKADEAGPILEAMSRLGKEEARRAAAISDRLRRTVP